MASSDRECSSRPNESSVYHTERDPDTQMLNRDYSLISVQPGVVAGRNIAVLGGLDTKGTEGVTRFITSRSGVEQLSAALAGKGLPLTNGRSAARDGMPWFQALVLVHLEKGDQVLSTELATVHALPPGNRLLPTSKILLPPPKNSRTDAVGQSLRPC